MKHFVDGQPYTAFVPIQVEILDAPEAPVEVDVTTQDMSIAENRAAGTLVFGGTLSIHDQDAGASVKCAVEGAQSSYFSIVPVAGSTVDTNGFVSLTPASDSSIAGLSVGGVGSWELRTAVVLDREDASMGLDSQGVVSVSVRCEDNTGLAVTAAVRNVRVLDENEAPQNVALQSGGTTTTVAENTPSGSIVGMVVAYDPDQGAAGDLTFSLSGPDAAFFEIVPVASPVENQQASILLAQGVSIDFEAKNSYSFDVVVDDGTEGGLVDTRRRRLLSASTTITVNVIDVPEPPTISDEVSSSYTVPEHAAPGTPLTGDL